MSNLKKKTIDQMSAEVTAALIAMPVPDALRVTRAMKHINMLYGTIGTIKKKLAADGALITADKIELLGKLHEVIGTISGLNVIMGELPPTLEDNLDLMLSASKTLSTHISKILIRDTSGDNW